MGSGSSSQIVVTIIEDGLLKQEKLDTQKISITEKEIKFSEFMKKKLKLKDEIKENYEMKKIIVDGVEIKKDYNPVLDKKTKMNIKILVSKSYLKTFKNYMASGEGVEDAFDAVGSIFNGVKNITS